MDQTQLSQIRQRLYAMRNGIVADALRKGGCPRRLIFGVNLPQLSEIACAAGQSATLADQLWADEDLREAQLIAPMLFPVESLDFDRALNLVERCRWAEETDILCLKLLRRAPFAPELAAELCRRESVSLRYAGLRLWFNLVATCPAAARDAAMTEKSRTDYVPLADALLAEAEFYLQQ